ASELRAAAARRAAVRAPAPPRSPHRPEPAVAAARRAACSSRTQALRCRRARRAARASEPCVQSMSRARARDTHDLVRERDFEVPGGRVRAVESDGERPLLFLHGFPDHPPTSHVFRAELAARGYRVLAPWLPGYSPSACSGPYDVRTVADRI